MAMDRDAENKRQTQTNKNPVSTNAEVVVPVLVVQDNVIEVGVSGPHAF